MRVFYNTSLDPQTLVLLETAFDVADAQVGRQYNRQT
jgi:hypothetical protein